jgi:hypothetical protein
MENTPITKAVPIVLPIDDWAELKLQSRKTGRSASAIVRDLVAAHLRGKKPRAVKAVKEGVA